MQDIEPTSRRRFVRGFAVLPGALLALLPRVT
jgi:hypothetical protein